MCIVRPESRRVELKQNPTPKGWNSHVQKRSNYDLATRAISAISLILRGGILMSIRGGIVVQLVIFMSIRGFPGKLESINLGRYNLSREVGRTPSSHTKNSQSKICSKGWVAQKPFVDR